MMKIKIHALAIATCAGVLIQVSDAAAGDPFAIQCEDNQELSRIVVRTNQQTEAFQFLGIECSRPDGGRFIFKVGTDSGVRHEIKGRSDLWG